MSDWVYIRTEPQLWTVGHYDGDGKFRPESDHGSPEEAAAHIRRLNGGADESKADDYLSDILAVIRDIRDDLRAIRNAMEA